MHRYDKSVTVPCPQCGTPFHVYAAWLRKSPNKCCSTECARLYRAERIADALPERFWDRADQRDSDGCWPWTGNRNEAGYGRFGVSRERGEVLAHRLSWELTYGAIPEGLFVCHRCDHPECVRPDHLFLGTHQDNMADTVTKGRGNGRSEPGELHGRARLKNSDIPTIRLLYAQGTSIAMIARQYHVGETTVRHVVLGETWAYIPSPH